MSCNKHSFGWTTCTLCRSGRQSLSTFERAKRRSIEWPILPNQLPTFEEQSNSCTIDEAFDSVLQYMSITTQHCNKFHKSILKKHTSDNDIRHVQRYHSIQPKQKTIKNPLQKPEDIHVEVAEGTCTFSAGAWCSDRQHTHVVHIDKGQTVDLMFGI